MQCLTNLIELLTACWREAASHLGFCMATEPPIAEARYRFRLRVRFAKGLSTEDTVRTFEFGGQSISISSQNPKEALSNAIWFLLGCGGFKTEQEAYQFGDQLRQALIIAGLVSRLGIDTGSDKPTTWMNEDFARSLGLLKPDERTAPNVHGLIVIPDDGNTRFPIISAEGKVTADPDQVIGAMTSLSSVPNFPPILKETLIILNMAMMNTQPIAQLALALSTVEALGQNEKWSDAQRRLIENLAMQAEAATSYEPLERKEVAEVMRRGLHRISLRHGVMRVLERLHLAHLKKEWDRIYGIRSKLIHGTDRPGENEIAQLANDAITLCGTIILTFAQEEGLAMPAVAAMHFPELK